MIKSVLVAVVLSAVLCDPASAQSGRVCMRCESTTGADPRAYTIDYDRRMIVEATETDIFNDEMIHWVEGVSNNPRLNYYMALLYRRTGVLKRTLYGPNATGAEATYNCRPAQCGRVF